MKPEALDAVFLPAGPAGHRRGRTAGYFASFMLFGLVLASLGPTIPALAAGVGAAAGGLGFLFAARSVGYLGGAFLGGGAYDRLPGNRLLGASLMSAAVLLASVPAARAAWQLGALFLLLGLGLGGMDVGCNTLMARSHPRRPGPYLVALHSFFGLGALAAPMLVVAAVWTGRGAPAIYPVMTALLLAAGVWVALAGSPPAEGGRVGSPGQGAAVPLSALALIFLYSGLETGFGGWIFTGALSTGLDPVGAGYLTSTFWTAFTLGRFLSIPASLRFEPRAILAADYLGCLAFASVITFLPGSPRALWLGTAGLGAAMAPIFPNVLSLVSARSPISGRAASRFFMSAGLGSMTLPWLTGALLGRWGAPALFATALAEVVLGGALYLVLRREAR